MSDQRISQDWALGDFVDGPLRREFRVPAYTYLRLSDELPEYPDLEEDPLLRVKLFGSGRFTYYVASATMYDGVEGPVLTGWCVSPLGPDCDEWGDQDLQSLALTRHPPFRLPMERDLYWTPLRLSDLRAGAAA